MLELLVATAVMLVILGAVLSQINSAIQVSNTTHGMTGAQQNLRFAHEFLNRDLVSAGDGLRGIGVIRVPEGFARSYLTRTPITDSGNAILPITAADNDVPFPTAVLGAATATNVYQDIFDGVTTQTDRISILMVDPSFAPISISDGNISGNGGTVSLNGATEPNPPGADVVIDDARFAARGFNAGEIYFLSSGNDAAFGIVTSINTGARQLMFEDVADTIDLGMNITTATGPINLVDASTISTVVTMRRMRIVHYYINSDKLLVRRTFGVNRTSSTTPYTIANGYPYTEDVVAEHIVRLQFIYKLNDLTRLSSFATDTQQKAVREVEIDIGAETVRPVVNGARQRVTMTTNASVRNLQFRTSL